MVQEGEVTYDDFQEISSILRNSHIRSHADYKKWKLNIVKGEKVLENTLDFPLSSAPLSKLFEILAALGVFLLSISTVLFGADGKFQKIRFWQIGRIGTLIKLLVDFVKEVKTILKEGEYDPLLLK